MFQFVFFNRKYQGFMYVRTYMCCNCIIATVLSIIITVGTYCLNFIKSNTCVKHMFFAYVCRQGHRFLGKTTIKRDNIRQ